MAAPYVATHSLAVKHEYTACVNETQVVYGWPWLSTGIGCLSSPSLWDVHGWLEEVDSCGLKHRSVTDGPVCVRINGNVAQMCGGFSSLGRKRMAKGT